jgi:hypothetical protein
MDDLEIITFADDARRKRHQAAISRRLGLDPAKTRNLNIEVIAGEPHARVTWEGIQHVPLADLHALIAPDEPLANTDGGAPSP